MMSDMYERLVAEAVKLLNKDKGATLTARELAAAVKLVFNGEMRAHAMSEGAKAVAKARG
jgi:histone H2B